MSPVEAHPADRNFYWFNAVLSSGALALLAWLLLFHRGAGAAGTDLSFMPALNACLNALSASLLLGGFIAIKRKNAQVHRYLMVSAFVSSALFLVGYLAYHYLHGDTKYAGSGAGRTIYLSILASHILLSVAVVPLALSALWFAFRRSFQQHKKVTRVLWPIWMYVSVTGVLIYFLLRSSYHQ